MEVYLLYCFFLFFFPFESTIKAARKILFSMLKLCLASSSTADIRHFIHVDLDDQGLNKTCADRTSSFTSSKLCQAAGVWF